MPGNRPIFRGIFRGAAPKRGYQSDLGVSFLGPSPIRRVQSDLGVSFLGPSPIRRPRFGGGLSVDCLDGFGLGNGADAAVVVEADFGFAGLGFDRISGGEAVGEVDLLAGREVVEIDD